MNKYDAGKILLTTASVFGVGLTAFLSAKATPTAIEKVKNDSRKNHDGDPYGYTKKEAVVSAWKCYVPCAISGTVTIACIFGIGVLGKKAQASLASACILLDKSFNEYKESLKELYGEEAHNAVIDNIMKEKLDDTVIYTPGLIGCETLNVESETEDVVRTFYDSFSGRYFEATLPRVLEAEYHLNRNYNLGGGVSVNEFYELLGLKPIDGGDCLGWDMYQEEILWIDISHRLVYLDDGMEVIQIIFTFEPTALLEETQ